MIFITGDCHQDYGRFNTLNFPEQKEMSKDDYVIVCGDFGYWLPSKEQDWNIDWLTDKPFTTLFIDGNHEYFKTNTYHIRQKEYKYRTGLMDLPVEKWHGGKVHKISDSVIHLMRGQIFEINGLSFFTFGGARSHDIENGILDPYDYGGPTSKKWKEKYKSMCQFSPNFRVKGWSWWEEEMPSEEEMEEAQQTLRSFTGRVDFMLSHEGPASAVAAYGFGQFETNTLSSFLQELDDSVMFGKHIFGHYHDNANILNRYILIYEQMLRVE